MVCSIVDSRCIVCSVREQVFRLCPLVITDPARTGIRVEGDTVFRAHCNFWGGGLHIQ